MRFPARSIAGNLVWARDGRVWAVWRVRPATYAWLPDHEKLLHHHRVRSLLACLPGESTLLGLCRRLDPGELAGRMSSGLDAPRPEWREAAARAADLLAEVGGHERLHFLGVELPSPQTGRGLAGIAGAAGGGVAAAFGLPSPPPGRHEVAARRRQADHLLSQLSSTLPLQDATPADLGWIYARAPLRGIADPAPRALPDGPPPPALATFGDAVLKEGGIAADPGRPRHRRYLRVETEDGVAYQAFLAVSDMPHRFRYPGGGEWLAAADAAPFPVDWCVRIRPVSNQDAQARARRQARQLTGQVGEYEGEPSGMPASLAEAMEGIQDLRAALSGNPADPELLATMVYAVWSPELEELEERVASLRGMFTSREYDLHRPTGGQLSLFETMLPGSPLPPAARDYTQYLLPRDLAAGAPFAGVEVGDPEGMLLGYSLDAGTFTPVLLDPARGPRSNRSASMAAFGALGSGKSYFIKSVAQAALCRGGQVVVLDRTVTGEYAALAGVAPGRTQVVRLAAGSDVSLDPLRVFREEERAARAIGFLTLLTGTAPSDLQGAALAEAVRAVAARPGGRLADVLPVLEAAAVDDPDASVVWRKLRALSSSELAPLVLGDAPVLALDADYIVLHTPGLSLPDREILLNEHLARQLLPEQVFSQALLYLVAAVARSVVFSDTGRFAAALFDEAWALTASMQGRALLLESVRDGRKHNAAVWLLSQHPRDLGDEELAHLLGSRFAFRQSHDAAAAALGFVGVEPTEQAVRLLVAAGEGACFLRDLDGRVGFVRVLEATSEELHEAFDTMPGRRTAGPPAEPVLRAAAGGG